MTPAVAETNPFGADAVMAVPDVDRRRMAAEAASALSLPSAETEEWRYGTLEGLTLSSYRPQTDRPGGSAPNAFPEIEERAGAASIVNGWVCEVSLEDRWAQMGVTVQAAESSQSRPVVAVDDTIFDALHLAFAPPALEIGVPDGVVVDQPIVLSTHFSADKDAELVASFPHVIVKLGDGAAATVIERQTSQEGQEGLSVPLLETTVGAESRLEFVVVQELARTHWQLGRQKAEVDTLGHITLGSASFGGRHVRTRTDTNLAGRGANGDLLTIYYSDGSQVHDFRTFQHHSAANTTSDLLFKGAVDDTSSSIYTGLIHIHPGGAGSNAHQTNRNIKLSDDAWAWSVPNLEIENNDVRCSHASTVSPLDEEQRFYLHSRGVPPSVADRLIVAGFFDEVIARLPYEAVRVEVRALVAEKLNSR